MKKWKRLATNPQWKKPLMIIIAGVLTLILIVPTLIVVPFIGTSDEEKEPVETENAEVEQPVAIKASDSPFSVKVFRTETEETEMVPLEEYVARVVASEMPAEFELEALKAQSLAARTYIVNHLVHQEESSLPENSDVTDTVEHQVYKSDKELLAQWGTDYNWKMNKINQAVTSTIGEIITYEDQPITPAFFSTSNGFTEDSENYWENELPYLRSVESPWDKDSPKYLDQKIVTEQQVEEILGIQVDTNSDQPFEISRTDSNRVAEMTVGGESFTGREIRESLDLRSSDFEVEHKNDHFIFTTKGYGHGIGMSQYGADGMAKEGKSYKEIVTYYYKGAEVAQVNNTAPKLASTQQAANE
ncbi:stage II sporulation protein D [Aquibacillus sediminis]|uniref:stage II sporulation protein D n=1 Tax=Aquibacillus sediminis TaxID=2574734 RepID=UPI001109AB67|nr:stage II sporulation protein D [Aquibacillus sediminis]